MKALMIIGLINMSSYLVAMDNSYTYQATPVARFSASFGGISDDQMPSSPRPSTPVPWNNEQNSPVPPRKEISAKKKIVIGSAIGIAAISIGTAILYSKQKD